MSYFTWYFSSSFSTLFIKNERECIMWVNNNKFRIFLGKSIRQDVNFNEMRWGKRQIERNAYVKWGFVNENE